VVGAPVVALRWCLRQGDVGAAPTPAPGWVRAVSGGVGAVVVAR